MLIEVPKQQDLDLFVNWPVVQQHVVAFLNPDITSIVITYIKSPLAWDDEKYAKFYNRALLPLPPITFDIDSELRKNCHIFNMKQIGHTHGIFPVPPNIGLPISSLLLGPFPFHLADYCLEPDPEFYWCLVPLSHFLLAAYYLQPDKVRLSSLKRKISAVNKQIKFPFYEIAKFSKGSSDNAKPLRIQGNCADEKKTSFDVTFGNSSESEIKITVNNASGQCELLIPIRKFYSAPKPITVHPPQRTCTIL